MFWPLFVLLLLIGTFSVGTGIWCFFTKDVKITSRLFRYIFLGFFLTAIIQIFQKPQEYHLKGIFKNTLGIFLIVVGLIAFYGVWLIVSSGLFTL